MIVLDPPANYRGRFRGCSHMISTLPGAEGSAELLAFALKIGHKASWLQLAGTAREHFDIFGSRRPRALAAGAIQVTRREFVGYIRAKREAANAGRIKSSQGG